MPHFEHKFFWNILFSTTFKETTKQKDIKWNLYLVGKMQVVQNSVVLKQELEEFKGRGEEDK